MELTKKPTRKDLLKVIAELQDLIGQAESFHGNDRNPHGFEQGQAAIRKAFQLCVNARSFDPPTDC